MNQKVAFEQQNDVIFWQAFTNSWSCSCGADTAYTFGKKSWQRILWKKCTGTYDPIQTTLCCVQINTHNSVFFGTGHKFQCILSIRYAVSFLPHLYADGHYFQSFNTFTSIYSLSENSTSMSLTIPRLLKSAKLRKHNNNNNICERLDSLEDCRCRSCRTF